MNLFTFIKAIQYDMTVRGLVLLFVIDLIKESVKTATTFYSV